MHMMSETTTEYHTVSALVVLVVLIALVRLGVRAWLFLPILPLLLGFLFYSGYFSSTSFALDDISSSSRRAWRARSSSLIPLRVMEVVEQIQSPESIPNPNPNQSESSSSS